MGDPVYVVRDTMLNLYSASWTENVHSQNIMRSEKAFLVSFDTTVRSQDLPVVLVAGSRFG